MIQAVNCPALNHDELQRNEAYVMHDAVAHTWERVEIISRTRQIQVLGRPQTFNYQFMKLDENHLLCQTLASTSSIHAPLPASRLRQYFSSAIAVRFEGLDSEDGTELYAILDSILPGDVLTGKVVGFDHVHGSEDG